MAIVPKLSPPLNAALLDSNGQISVAWHEYFVRLADRVASLEARLAAAEIP